MKNLKRVLSLALASVMVMGMMVVSASAADFTDDEKIVNQNAVDTMVALNIINGKDDGSFDPEAVVTRAEMAKMITVALNGGVDPVLGTKTQPTYTDIKGHWAESYIEYCNSFGIVGGIGGGKFEPEGKLTSTQAARMSLNAMGYGIEDPSNWALLTEVQAREEGVDLYAGSPTAQHVGDVARRESLHLVGLDRGDRSGHVALALVAVTHDDEFVDGVGFFFHHDVDRRAGTDGHTLVAVADEGEFEGCTRIGRDAITTVRVGRHAHGGAGYGDVDAGQRPVGVFHDARDGRLLCPEARADEKRRDERDEFQVNR